MTKKRILITGGILVVLAGLIWFGFFVHQNDKRASGRHGQARSVPVLTAKAKTGDVPVILEGVGTIQAYQTVTVKPQVSGKLLHINFKEGQMVHKGDVLAKIDPVTYQADLDKAEAQVDLDQAALANARLDLKRYAKLAKTNYVSKQKADQARATVSQDKAQVAADKAAVASARATLGYTSVVAPITGRTGIRMVDEGNIVDPNSSDGIVVLTQIQPITAVFTLPSDQIGPIRKAADQSELPVTVTGAHSDKALDKGRLEVINNQVDTDTGTIKLKARLPNENQQLWPGQFVNVRLQVGTRHNATVVPIAAVQQGPSGAFVYTIGPDRKASMRDVEVVQQNENRAVIGQGIKPGEAIITAGFGQLSDGARVKVSKPENDAAHLDQSGADGAGKDKAARQNHAQNPHGSSAP